VSALRTHDADLALAARDDALPCLAHVLDDARLSELVGEPVHITRVRYKPRTSVLVAFRRSGTDDHGWALSTKDNAKLDGRARAAARMAEQRGGPGVRLIRPALPGTDAVIAVGGIEDDWLLRKNLRWLADYGLEALGVGRAPGAGLTGGTARVLRYKPERRLVLLEQTPAASVVIKTAAPAADPDAQQVFHQQLQRHGVPVLPRLEDAACSRHGISASPVWGALDLTANRDAEGARKAGVALARLHGIPAGAAPGPAAPSSDTAPASPSSPASPEALVARQLGATCAMVAELVPALACPAAEVAGRLRRRLDETAGGRTPVLIHGDFSADQVRVSGAEVRLIDFDRARAGAPECDLGSFAAVEEISRWRADAAAEHVPHTGPLIDGYTGAGGRFTPTALNAWTAYRLFCNSVDPFRDRDPDWAAEMSRYIDSASGLIP